MNMRVLCFYWLLANLFCTFQAPAEELSYRRITMKDKLRKFYQTGGKSYYGKRVHILVSADVFRREHKIVQDPKGRPLYLFKNKTVPILVRPSNLYYKRLLRKLAWQKKKIQTVSVFAKLIRPSWDLKGRNHLFVYKLKTYGGGLKKIGRLRPARNIPNNVGKGRDNPAARAGAAACAWQGC